MKKDQKIYIKEDQINLRKTPDTSSDANIIRKLKIGEEAILIDEPWLKVKIGEQDGWVRSDKTSENVPIIQSPSNSYLPNFIRGQAHPANHPNTLELRKIINDEFGGEANGWNLQCTEYVMYRIKTKLGIDINWPVKSGRDGGKWWKIFQDAGLYKILTEPQVNCAACFTEVRGKDGVLIKEGHVVFVEEVKPDGSVIVFEANWPGEGIYSEREITKERWQSHYKAKFVSFV